MTTRLRAMFAFIVLSTLSLPQFARAKDFPKLSPYPAIRWRQPEVWVDGRWQLLRSIDGIAVEKIVEFAISKYEERWQKRFDEDLVQVLSEMGYPPGKTVTLVVRDPASGKDTALPNVPMTEENRR